MMADFQKKSIGFIGIGVMGQGMASNLILAGYPVHVYTRTKLKAATVLKQGAVWHETVAKVVENTDVIITMVGYPSDVEEIYLSDYGIVQHAKPGSYLIDMTTSSPSLAKRIYEEAQSRQLHSLDAPVSGSDIGAREGRLSIMIGGDEADFHAVLPIFQAMGKNIVLQGPAGSGQYTKMCNQIVVASNMVGICEGLVFAKKSGLDPLTVLKSIETGAAGSWGLSNIGPRIIQGDFEPGFYVKHFIKDMGIAIQSAEELGLPLPGLALAKSLYDQLAEMGESESGVHALFKLFSRGTHS
jgi:3-hydroxyisobutyrate dehydrogenase